jgi:transcription elongation factor GreA
MVMAMTDERFPILDGRPGSQPIGRTDHLLTEADYAALVRELESLQARHRRELAERLRVARSFSAAPDGDDLLAVLEEAAIEQARIAQLEELLRTASVVDGAGATDGTAALGTIVRVLDDSAQTTEYELVGRRTRDSHGHAVSLASPVGKALHGAGRGDVVEAVLPSGRRRTLRVLEVRTGVSAARVAEAA